MNSCDVLVQIDDRVRSKGFPTKKSTEPLPIVQIEHSPTYNNLHQRIKSAIKNNNEKNFEMEPSERKEEHAPIVYLSETADWSKYTAIYKGEDYRTTLDASIDEIYSQMLTNHEKNLLK